MSHLRFRKKRWGIYDTVDHVWLGDDDGPKVYDNYDIARCAAQVMDVRLAQPPKRTVAKRYYDQPKRLRDSVDPKRSVTEALRLIELGYIGPA